MKCLSILFFLLVLSCVGDAQVITTIAGNGINGDGSPAISAGINNPCGLAFDKYGNLYFATNLANTIRKIDTAGIITTVAGTGSAGYSGDNDFATAAELNQPTGVAIDSIGNIYIADASNNRIRRITVSTGIITTVAGNGFGGYTGDNVLATITSLYEPMDICFDNSGNLYIADAANHRLRMVNTLGIISTIAGNGLLGCTGDGGAASNAKCVPTSVRINKFGDIYVGEFSNMRVRKINTFGIISAIAGDSISYIYNGDEIPATNANINPQFIALDSSGELYISDYTNNRIRKVDFDGIIHTVIGNGINGNRGDYGPADSAEISYPSGIVFDRCDNLYFGQVDTPRIRKVTFNSNCWPEETKYIILQNKVSIYPNPAGTLLTMAATQKINNIAIQNAIGQALITLSTGTEKVQLNISTLPPGIYVVKVNGIYVDKLVKE